MKKINLLLLLLFIFSFVHCEGKPEKSFYGIPNDDKDKFVAGLILNSGSRSTSVGTVVDSTTGLEWKKCSQGQTFRSANNDCQGNPNSAGPATLTSIGNYGAGKYSFCNLEGNYCNVTSLPQELNLAEQQRNKASSAAFFTCITDRTGGFTNWRLPTSIELKALTTTGQTAMTINFPNSPEDSFWTAWGNENDQTGKTARAINMTRNKFGEEEFINKTTNNSVRCVRRTNGQ